MSRTWSAQQDHIFEWFKNSTVPSLVAPEPGTIGDAVYDKVIAPRVRAQHLIVRARAGTGKSTTIREGVKRAPERHILVAAFSKQIQLAMEKSIRLLPDGAVDPRSFAGEVKTLHAVGYACVRNFRDRIRVQFNSERADDLAFKACGPQAPSAIVKLVSKLHTKGREIAPHASKLGDLTTIAINFECEPDEQYERIGFGLEYVEAKALEAMELAAQIKDGETIDGSDMIFLPVRNGWLTKQFDLVVVDEAQDMTTAQLEIALGVLKAGGRICVVGDDRQAIFGFRGADSESLDRLKAELGAAELGLITTYRCGRRIVELARAIVPDFEAGPNNADGEVLDLYADPAWAALVAAAGPGDMVLSRVNAPLVSIAMKMLRAGKRTQVAGKKIGDGLVALVRKFNAKSVPDLLRKIEAWAARERQRHEAQKAAATNGRKKALEAKIEEVMDKADMLTSLTDGAKSVSEVTARIEALFVPTGDEHGAPTAFEGGVITCSSVHRAKGQEADRVFILADTLRDDSVEEFNIQYVAVTRAKNTLVWVR